MPKGSSELRCTKTGQHSNRIKSFKLTNQNSKSLDQIGGSMCGKELIKELQPPYWINCKTCRRLCYGGWGRLLPIAKSGICIR